MLDWIRQPWPWPIAGLLVGLTVPVLLLLGNKKFGISSTLRQVCAACIPAGIPFFSYDWKKESWNLFFVAGIAIGAFLAHALLENPALIEINSVTIQDLQAIGITSFNDLMPHDLFSWNQLFTLRGFVFMVLGGFLVGFGTRYAGGTASRTEAQAELQHVPGLGAAVPAAEFVTPGGLELRTAQAFRIFGGKELRRSAVGPDELVFRDFEIRFSDLEFGIADSGFVFQTFVDCYFQSVRLPVRIF